MESDFYKYKYKQLREAVVQVLDAEIGDDVVAIRQILMAALGCEQGSDGDTVATSQH